MKTPDPEPSLVQPELEYEPQGPRHLTESQARALAELASLAQLAGHDATYAGIRVRSKPLIIGPSGAGKSALMARVCDLLSTPRKRYPLLEINSGSWVVFAAKASPATLETIRSFVRDNDTGCILLDECDKVLTAKDGWKTSWELSTCVECLALLDNSERLTTSGWTPADVAKLRKFWIVGAGAWQHLAVDSEKGDSHADRIKAHATLPEELTFRFNSRLIPVTLPSEKDFRNILGRLYRDLGLELPKPADLEKLLAAAISSRTGMRFVEQHLSDILCLYPRLRRDTPSASSTPPKTADQHELNGESKKPGQTDRTIIPVAQYQKIQDHVYTMTETLEAPLVHVQALFRIHEQRFEKFWSDILDTDTGAPISPNRLQVEFNNLLDGLRHQYTTGPEMRKKRQDYIWLPGHNVLLAVWTAINTDAAFLQENGQLTFFTEAYTKLSRLLVAWENLTTYLPEGFSS